MLRHCFRSVTLMALCCATARVAAAQQPEPPPAPLTAAVRQAVIDSVSAAVLRTYVFEDTARRMADWVASRARAGAYDTIVVRGSFANALTRDLRHTHDDRHLRIVHDPAEAAAAMDTTHREARDRSSVDRRSNVGDTTGGGAHVLRRVALGNGYVGYIPYIRGVNTASRSDWEGAGIVPDLTVESSHALLAARELLLRERRAGIATDTTARRAIDWAIEEARVDEHLIDVPVAILATYQGRFEEYTFSLRNGRLYAVNASRDGKTNRLEPISPSSFRIDAETHVEFVTDPDGSVSRIRVLWNDGWLDVIRRAR